MEHAKILAEKLRLSSEDTSLAELIALLHDIGRFEEIIKYKRFDSYKIDHAEYGVKVLFEENKIRDFIDDDSYDEIIKKSIENHNKLALDGEFNERELLHAKLIRDADKLDNFRVLKEEKNNVIFHGKVNKDSDLENSLLSDNIFQNIKEHKCINIIDRKTPLDYFVCALAFTFDLNFKVSYGMVKENDYINGLIDRFNYKNAESKERMEEVRRILNEYVNNKYDVL